jgi:hypothetical protein
MLLLDWLNTEDWPNIVGRKVSWAKVVLGHLRGAGEPAGSMVCWVFCCELGVPSREKSPVWVGGAGGAELEVAADAERGCPKPMEVRGTWDIVPSEGEEGGL